jgi:hypothetical protein
MRPGRIQELDDRPLHVSRADGEARLQPCAEAYLNDRAAVAILDEGLMPLLSVAGRDAVSVPRFQSLAEPERPLAGRWVRS